MRSLTLPAGAVPTWTLADRLRKARVHAELEQDELAEILGIARQSISNYERGQTRPNKPVCWAWAAATGVDGAWLLGDEGELPRLDSNQQPAGYGVEDGLALTAAALRELVPLRAAA